MNDPAIIDQVAADAPGSIEIGFNLPDRYNASELLFDNLDRGLADKVAIHAQSGDVTYGQLCDQASRTGNALASLGLNRGDRVMLMLDDIAAYPAILFGAIRAGFVPMLINTLSPRALVKFYLTDSGARVAVVDERTASLIDDEVTATSGVEAVIYVDTPAGSEHHFSCHGWRQWITQHSAELPAADTKRNDMAFWMYSSGSTGRPKGIVHLQHDMLFTAQSYAKHVLSIGPNDICFSVPKIFFAYGLGNSIVFPFSVGASAVLLEGRPVAGPIVEHVARFRPTLFFGLPTLYNSLMRSEEIKSADFSSVRLCLSAAEVLSADLALAWKDQFGHEIVEGMGSTEMTHIYLSNLPGDTRHGAAGKRVPGYELKLLDRDNNEVEQGEEGILWVRGDSSAPCYWNRLEKTAKTMRGDWLWTGDRLVEDADGFHFFKGRADDLIKVSGQWVYPLEIEICLNDHPKVSECAVLGVEQKDRRMTLKAFIVPKVGIEASAELTGELQDYVKQALMPYKYPRLVEYIESLPKTGTGKIDRQALTQAMQS